MILGGQTERAERQGTDESLESLRGAMSQIEENRGFWIVS